MCTELGLAILYFVTIFCVNFFLFKVLKNYFENIVYLKKVKNIFIRFFNKKELKLVSGIFLILKKNIKNRSILERLNSYLETTDPLIIGNIYFNLLRTKENKNINNLTENFYFELLENQYLSRNINLK